MRGRRWLLALLLASGLAVRLWLALGAREDGIYWPDEIFQSLEPAHRLVFGYGLVPWEFVAGARNWAFPGFVAGLLAFAKTIGLTSPSGYLAFVRVVMCAIAVGSALGCHRLARRLGASSHAAFAATALYLFSAPCIYFSHRALSETSSALPVVFGLALALPPQATRRERVVGAVLLVVATLLRLQCAVFCVGLLGAWLLRARRREAFELAGVFAIGGFLYGLLDRLTWGSFFHSAVVYLKFNLVDGKASNFGTAKASYYVETLLRAMPLSFVVVVAATIFGWSNRTRALAVIVGLFFALHTMMPHKELRFLLPELPLFFALAGVGLGSLERFVPRWRLFGIVGTTALLSLISFHSLTGADLGMADESSSAYDRGGSVNRLLLVANRVPDLCGIKTENTHVAFTGGLSYLHRRVRLYGNTGPARPSRAYNYVITEHPDGAAIEATDGKLSLAKLFDGRCNEVPWSSRLP